MSDESMDFEDFVPTMHLRWRRTASGIIPGTDGMAVTAKAVLEQMWQDEKGNQRWIRVPIVDERERPVDR